MHGNTKTFNKYKVRYFDDMINETKQVITILSENGYYLSGFHIEATYENITECIGGNEDKVTEDMISKNYTTYCDPRLNFKQVYYFLIFRLLSLPLKYQNT